MKRALLSASFAIALGAAPPLAQAQPQPYAFTAGVVNLRAGPGAVYPIVSVVPGGVQVNVFGCLSDYSWCDVAAGPQRGWIYARYLNYPYQNSYAPLATVGAIVGIAALVFILDDYWGEHYRHRSWYPERRRWEHVGPRYAPPPPPSYRVPHAYPPAVRPPHYQARPYSQPVPEHRGGRAEPPGQARRHDNGGPPGQRGREDGRGRGHDNGPPGQRQRD